MEWCPSLWGFQFLCQNNQILSVSSVANNSRQLMISWTDRDDGNLWVTSGCKASVDESQYPCCDMGQLGVGGEIVQRKQRITSLNSCEVTCLHQLALRTIRGSCICLGQSNGVDLSQSGPFHQKLTHQFMGKHASWGTARRVLFPKNMFHLLGGIQSNMNKSNCQRKFWNSMGYHLASLWWWCYQPKHRCSRWECSGLVCCVPAT